MDTLGAILGPAIALSLVGFIALRHIFLIAFIPAPSRSSLPGL